ncbi:MAG: DMT family transporter [Patescibacteria group bacterium]|nr:DMT family transporter [Patescibacteria group bacterium]MBU1870929.1 DMT family transporter [Patescibacteria group bacterium]
MWLNLAIFAYFINAGVFVADKFLLSKKIHSSIAYAFYVGIWSIFNLILLLFDPWLPTIPELIIDLLAGGLFLLTLIFWYKALHQSEATRVVPIVGALVPIFSFILSYFFFNETLNKLQLLAFLILICGGILISVKQTKLYLYQKVIARIKDIYGNILGNIHAKYQPARRLLINAVISAWFFASYYVLIKYIYIHQPFIGGFVWSRVGSFIGVLTILLVTPWRKLIIKQQQGSKTPKNLFFFFLVRLLAAGAFIMLNLAISLGNVAIINALQGVQYLFLFLIILLLSAKFPNILKEKLDSDIIMQKVIGIFLIGIGLYLLVM